MALRVPESKKICGLHSPSVTIYPETGMKVKKSRFAEHPSVQHNFSNLWKILGVHATPFQDCVQHSFRSPYNKILGICSTLIFGLCATQFQECATKFQQCVQCNFRKMCKIMLGKCATQFQECVKHNFIIARSAILGVS